MCEKKILQKDTEKSAQIKKSHSVRKTYFKKIDETTVIITKDYSKNEEKEKKKSKFLKIIVATRWDEKKNPQKILQKANNNKPPCSLT